MTSYRLVSVIYETPETVTVNELPIPYEFEVGSLHDLLIIRVAENASNADIDALVDCFNQLCEEKIVTHKVIIVPYGTDFLGIEEIDK